MKNNTSSMYGENSLDKNKKIEKDLSDFTESGLEEYIKKGGRSLKVENLKVGLKYEEIDKDSRLQENILEATFRSELYPDIMATSSIDSTSIKCAREEEKDLESFRGRVYGRLSSSGNSNLEAKELAYFGAITKQEIINEKAEWMKGNNIKIENVKITHGLRKGAYVYLTTLCDIDNDTHGSGRGSSLDKALQNSLKELRSNQETYKKGRAQAWKKDPEFMYTKEEYEDELKKLGFRISRHEIDKGTNTYSLSVSRPSSVSVEITIQGSSWEEVFKNAITEAQTITEGDKKQSKRFLNVASFSIKEMLSLLNSSKENIHSDYFEILEDKLEKNLDNNEEIILTDQEVIDVKNRCIKKEKYELAAKITRYLKNKE